MAAWVLSIKSERFRDFLEFSTSQISENLKFLVGWQLLKQLIYSVSTDNYLTLLHFWLKETVVKRGNISLRSGKEISG